MSRLQLFQHYAAHPQGKIVSESGGFFRFLPQGIRLEDGGFGRLDRPRTELPLVRRKKPGPTERLACAKRLNRNEAFSGNVCWRIAEAQRVIGKKRSNQARKSDVRLTRELAKYF